MPGGCSRNVWVFREGRSTVSGKSVLDGTRSALERICAASGGSRDARVDALLRAGELECALADAAAPGEERAAGVTDAVAGALVEGPGWRATLDSACALLQGIAVPESVSVSPPEGFVYYAVHPLDFAALANDLSLQGSRAAVVGIRSIGTTLSAVVNAALLRRGVKTQRITVRPTGHPYDRQTAFSPAQLRWIAQWRAASANFLVVDEGPGISGSSFLSVGDALLEAGVARASITFLGSRYAEPETLAAKNGAARWRSFRSVTTAATAHTPADRGVFLGGGEWRRRSYDEESRWPASWVQMERLKFLSGDGRRIYKFHGLGRFGEAVAARARLLAETGFGPRLLAHASGFSELEVVDGRPMDATQISSAALERVADYCALRALEFAAPAPRESQLEAMVRFNLGELFGGEPSPSLVPLENERPVIADGRMLPHEWLSAPGGTLVKTDGATHGDDHLFPGPVDVAWDLAGAIIEWEMTPEAVRYMLARYRRRSGDDASGRIAAYMLAYSVFRAAYCAMAAFTMRGSSEEPRLRRAEMHYRTVVEARLKAPAGRPTSGERNVRWNDRRAGVEGMLALADGSADGG